MSPKCSQNLPQSNPLHFNKPSLAPQTSRNGGASRYPLSVCRAVAALLPCGWAHRRHSVLVRQVAVTPTSLLPSRSRMLCVQSHLPQRSLQRSLLKRSPGRAARGGQVRRTGATFQRQDEAGFVQTGSFRASQVPSLK